MAFNKLKAMSREEKINLRYKTPHKHIDYLDNHIRDMKIKYELAWEGKNIIEQDKTLIFGYIENDLMNNNIDKNIKANTNIIYSSMKEEVAYTDGKTISLNNWLSDKTEMAKTIIAHEFGHIYLDHFSDYYKKVEVELYRLTEKRIEDILTNTGSFYNNLEGKELISWLNKNKNVKRALIKQYSMIIRGIVFDYDVNDRLIDENEYLSFFVKQMPFNAFLKLMDNCFDPVNTPIVPSAVGSNRPWDLLYNANLIIDESHRLLPKIEDKDDQINQAMQEMQDMISSLLKDIVSDDSHLDNLPDSNNSGNGSKNSNNFEISKNNNNTNNSGNSNNSGKNSNNTQNSDNEDKSDDENKGGVSFAKVESGQDTNEGGKESSVSGSNGKGIKDFNENDKIFNEQLLDLYDDIKLPEVNDTKTSGGHSNGKSLASAKVKLKEPIDDFYDLIVKSSKLKKEKKEFKRDPIKLYNSGKLGRRNKVLIPTLRMKHQISKKYDACRAIFIVDVSSSMSANEISKIVSTVHKAFTTNRRKYDFSIITWNTDLVRVLDLNNLEEIEIGGGTEIARGIKYAVENFHKSKDDNIFVISDFEDYLDDWDSEVIKSKFYNYENTFAVKTSNGVRSKKLENFKEISLVKKGKSW